MFPWQGQHDSMDAMGDLKEGKVRVFANAGVGGMRALHWHDLDTDDPMLESWRAAGLVSDVDHKGNGAPETMPRGTCCGG